MVAALAVTAVLLLSLGVAVGWATRGRVAHWCVVHGETLTCPACRPSHAADRATAPGRSSDIQERRSI